MKHDHLPFPHHLPGRPPASGASSGVPQIPPPGFPKHLLQGFPGDHPPGPPSSLGTTTHSPGSAPVFAHLGLACCVGAYIQTPPPRLGVTRPHLQPPGLPGAAGTEAHIRSRNLGVKAQTSRQLRPFSLPTPSRDPGDRVDPRFFGVRE